MSDAKKKKDDAPVSLEKALERLEEIVTSLESGDADLEKSIDLYREGRELGRFCLDRLNALEKQVVQLKKDADGGLKIEDLPVDDL